MKDPGLYIVHMLECIGYIEQCIARGEETVRNDPLTRGAFIRYFQELSESAKRLPENVRTEMKPLPWQNIVGLRNILVHDYLWIEVDILIAVARKEILDLKNELLHWKENYL